MPKTSLSNKAMIFYIFTPNKFIIYRTTRIEKLNINSVLNSHKPKCTVHLFYIEGYYNLIYLENILNRYLEF